MSKTDIQSVGRKSFPSTIHAIGFSFWKKPVVADFCGGSSVLFVEKLDDVPRNAQAIAVWGLTQEQSLGDWLGGCQTPPLVVRIEDGFLRSVGLGADLIRPVSWVLDKSGIYYDATRPSDLETIFQNQIFDDETLIRARLLREWVVSSRLTKYNVGLSLWCRPMGKSRVILVPGQVESDASIAFGAPEGVCTVRRNMDLLRAVRAANPDAWVVYKPHPDVLAGLRVRGLNEKQALQWCDEQVTDASMGEMLDQVDEVHVITSLAGFEALLRGKRVVCYGQPFYASWGLTEDMAPVARRTRRLSLDELGAGALILYPTYVSRTTGRFTTPERALDELLAWRESGASTLPWWRKVLRMFLRFYKR